MRICGVYNDVNPITKRGKQVKTNREELLRTLESVAAGLATREVVEQSSCFVFQDDRVVTFNDELYAAAPCESGGITAAVSARQLLNVLRKLKEDVVDVSLAENGELVVAARGRRSGIRAEADIALPFDKIPEPDEWNKLDPDFGDAVQVVQACASKDDSSWVLTCVHIHPEYLEACDNFQMARFPIKTGITEQCLVRGVAIRHFVGLGMTEIGVSDAWLHARNPAGLTIACRRWVDEEYEDMAELLDVQGASATLPGGLAEAVNVAEVFSVDNVEDNNVLIELKNGKLRLRGEGPAGWYEERKAVKYSGEPLSFLIAPRLLQSIVKQTNDCTIVPGRLRFDAGKFTYVACLGEVDG